MILPDIEAYLEFIGGWKDKNGKSITQFFPKPILQLANYDVGFITSVSEQINNSVALSDRQAGLTYKIIEKYERQLHKHGVDIPNHRNHRLGIRVVNRVSSAYIGDGNMICLKFPYSEQMINTIKACGKDSQGVVKWTPENKEWQFALTEYNLSWVHAFATSHKMTIDASVQELFDLMTECEQTPFAIELRVDSNGATITNIPTSMREWIDTNIGFGDLYKLVDYAGVLGYTIDKEITSQFELAHGKDFVELCAGREINRLASASIDEVMEWAKIVNRFPICVFNPNFTKINTASYAKHFDMSEIKIIDMKEKISDSEPFVLDPKIKLVYTNKVLPNWEGRMPLLITYANLMHGATKRSFMGKAEKVVYHCETLPRV
jgi:hypothetical protein